LHAERLEFIHPVSLTAVEWQAPPPDDMRGKVTASDDGTVRLWDANGQATTHVTGGFTLRDSAGKVVRQATPTPIAVALGGKVIRMLALPLAMAGAFYALALVGFLSDHGFFALLNKLHLFHVTRLDASLNLFSMIGLILLAV
jgi:hypothetical protein